jgi:hypothetical protein
MRTRANGDDWSAALDEIIGRNPARAWGRAGLGWSALETGQATEAQSHFEQALTLNPTAEWARSGLIEALKARNPIYSAILQLFLWIDRLPQRTKVIYFLAGWFGYRFLSVSVRENPGLGVIAYPLMAVWVLFLVISWTSDPLSDFILSRTAEGRRLVHGERLLAARLVTGLLATALASGAVAWLLDSDRAAIASLCSAFLVIPAAAVFQCHAGWPRRVMTLYAAAAAVLTAVALVAPVDTAWGFALGVIVMSAIGSWLAALLRNRLPAS